MFQRAGFRTHKNGSWGVGASRLVDCAHGEMLAFTARLVLMCEHIEGTLGDILAIQHSESCPDSGYFNAQARVAH